jgi:hypothetical protein
VALTGGGGGRGEGRAGSGTTRRRTEGGVGRGTAAGLCSSLRWLYAARRHKRATQMPSLVQAFLQAGSRGDAIVRRRRVPAPDGCVCRRGTVESHPKDTCKIALYTYYFLGFNIKIKYVGELPCQKKSSPEADILM